MSEFADLEVHTWQCLDCATIVRAFTAPAACTKYKMCNRGWKLVWERELPRPQPMRRGAKQLNGKRRADVDLRVRPGMSVYEMLGARDGWACAYCGDEDEPLTKDHVWPQSRNGANALANYALACNRCQADKANKLLWEWRGRWYHQHTAGGWLGRLPVTEFCSIGGLLRYVNVPIAQQLRRPE